MGSIRLCSRSACRQPAIATLTYVYADSTAVLGPLATFAEPHCYDLCAAHAERLTVPRGWDVVRLELPERPRLESDDLSALADAVREDPSRVAAGDAPGAGAPPAPRNAPEPLEPPADAEAGRPRLRVLRGPS
ncbi:DUF3499 domain-containing protein [Zafaria sp. Z1313]|uniref:DUF3499 domain-containing protein n=1 Tax=unclassified Zafaria TaxID=2828765 RepID=UPI002E7827B5|nr:DUF3499 domain-containing protein [Zafaria sp. J156]MEE1619950.1 DUF3499 domain-containing protein [Zafaria sp. J156]